MCGRYAVNGANNSFKKGMRYFIYCRKSSESEDRQILSIDSQKSELRSKFGSLPGVEIVEIFEESFSAKAPGRVIFGEMMRRLQAGEADGLIAWHPDRLSRNSVDAGHIIYLLDLRIVKDLRFATYTFEDTPEGKLMLSMILSYSKYYSDALSKNIKRGNRAKLALGWRPNSAPIGYLNDAASKTIIPDPDRFPLLREIWKLALTECYTPRMIYEKARDDWRLRTPQKKRTGGKPLSLSGIYRILANPFYAGLILWDGKIYDGKHTAMISVEDFEKVQKFVKRKQGKPRPKKYTFAYTGMMRCGECGCVITAEKKVNRFDSHYIYYHCTHRKTEYRCKQPSVEVKALEAQFIAFLQSITVPAALRRLILRELENARIQKDDVRRQRKLSIKKDLDRIQKRRDNVTHLRLSDMITDEEFKQERMNLDIEEKKRRQSFEKIDKESNTFEPLEEVISFANRAVSLFESGDAHVKRQILSIVGSNPVLRDKKVTIEAKKPFVLLSTDDGFSHVRGAVKDIRKLAGDGGFSTTVDNIRTIKRERSII